MPVNTQTKLPRTPPEIPEAPPQARPSVLPKPAKAVGPKAYWGDRLTLKFWLFCFGLMVAINLVEALYRFVLFLMVRSPAP